MREIKSVVLHCTATPKDRIVSVAEIRKWHVKERGWSDIGYHFVIQQDGTIERGRHIGVAYCGGVEKKIKKSLDKDKPKSKTILVSKDTMTKEQVKAFRNLFEMLEVFFGELKLSGHNDHNKAKDCPSFNMRDKFGDLINR